MPDFSKVSKADKIKFALFVVVFIGLVALGIAFIPFFSGLVDEQTRMMTVEKIQSKGPSGVLILMALQLLQVVVAFIPGEVVQLMAGILYGGVWGVVICLTGVVISTFVIFFLVRKLGLPFVRSMVSEKQMSKLKFLQENKKLDTIVFILFLIPAMPKDVITYLIPLTDMPLSRFFCLSLIARVPALAASTYAGAAFTDGSYTTMIILLVICGGLGLITIIFNDKILNFISRKREVVKERLVETHTTHKTASTEHAMTAVLKTQTMADDSKNEIQAEATLPTPREADTRQEQTKACLDDTMDNHLSDKGDRL